MISISEVKQVAISRYMVADMFNFFKKKMDLDKDLAMECFQDFEGEFGLVYEEKNNKYNFIHLELPCWWVGDGSEDMMNDILKEKYHIDIPNYFKGLSEGMNSIIFSLLHEFSHFYQYLNLSDEEFANVTNEYKIGLKAVDDFAFSGGELREIQEMYRSLNEEVYADKLAIDIMRNYKDEIFELFHRYDVENSEMDFGFGFYEVQ